MGLEHLLQGGARLWALWVVGPTETQQGHAGACTPHLVQGQSWSEVPEGPLSPGLQTGSVWPAEGGGGARWPE